MVRRWCFGFVFLSMIMSAALLFFGAPQAQAAVWTVTNGGDTYSEGTLRHALASCGKGDEIKFASGVTVVTLTDLLSVWPDTGVTITGPVTITQTNTIVGVISVYSGATCTIRSVTIQGGRTQQSGGGVWNFGTLTMENCTVQNNTAWMRGGGVMNNCGSLGSMTLKNCTITGNTVTGTTYNGGDSGAGGGVHNESGVLKMIGCTVTNNRASSQYGVGGGIRSTSLGKTSLSACTVKSNTPDNISGEYSSDGTNTIGNSPNKSATAFSGFAGETAPEPRSIIDDVDVAEVKRKLTDSGSDLFAAVSRALSSDLGRTPDGTSATLAGLTTSLYYANTFENVGVESRDLVVEYTASWPENARYYALFARADESGYELAERGIQFEIKAGQSLPDGSTPPDFYEEGEGLMTWRNVVTDGGAYDLNPAPGLVTFRVCSIRAEAQMASSGGSGCSAATASPFVLLPAIPLIFLRKR